MLLNSGSGRLHHMTSDPGTYLSASRHNLVTTGAKGGKSFGYSSRSGSGPTQGTSAPYLQASSSTSTPSQASATHILHNTTLPSPLSLPSLSTPTTHLELRDTPYSIVETPEISHPLLNPGIQELQPTSLCLLDPPVLGYQNNPTTPSSANLPSTMEQQPQQPSGGALGPTGRRLHIAHRRSPSELTPLMSMFSNPGSELP